MFGGQDRRYRYLSKKEGPIFFIFEWSVLQDYFYENYKGGVRPKNPKSTHCLWKDELSVVKSSTILELISDFDELFIQ
jgi:hypothetical protein